MEKNILIISLTIASHLCSAVTLKLSGTVPDRGIAVSSGGVQALKNSNMKVFISTKLESRWRQLYHGEIVTTSSLVRVMAL